MGGGGNEPQPNGATEYHLDALGGIAGDMFIAAVLDAFPVLVPGTLAAIRSVAGEGGAACELVPHRDAVLTGSRFVVQPPLARSQPSVLAAPAHPHASFVDIRRKLEASSLPVSTRSHATGIFTALAEAEAAVHGVPVDEVTFHEVGNWDSIADVVGAAHLIAALGAEGWTVSALPSGSGRVKTDHGLLPVPAPATLRLLAGFELIDDGIAGERVTPTGAAILRYLGAKHRGPVRRRRVVTHGHGFGTRTLPGCSNVLRLIAYAPGEDANTTDEVLDVVFEVDDQTAEDLAIGIERMRAHPAVIDVLQAAVFGKKGRLATQVRVLARADGLDEVAALCFAETTTLGLRWQRLQRRFVPRRATVVSVGDCPIGVKVAERPGGSTAKAEADDLRAAGVERRGREALRRAAEAGAEERKEPGK